MTVLNDNLDPDGVAWCKKLLNSLNDHGVWGVPRSGLMFQRQGDMLVLIDRMPYMDGMPVTPAQLVAQQDAEFELTRRYFAAAGITVAMGLGSRK
jgi:hypothetical protein